MQRDLSGKADGRALLFATLPTGQFSPIGADACCRERARDGFHDGFRAGMSGPSSEGLGVTDKRRDHLTLILRPHIEERNGCRFHVDRFDACLNGELSLTSRQPWHDAARELIRRGYPGDRLLTIRHADQDDDRVVPLEIGNLAQWSISDSDRSGLKRVRWQPMPEYLKQRGRE